MPKFSLQGKNVLITGASSGIGKALAIELSSYKCSVILIARDLERLKAVADLCKDAGAAYVDYASIDVYDHLAMESYIANIPSTYFPDLVIANAGISAGSGDSMETAEQVRKIFNTNLIGVVNTIHPCLETMKTRGNGVVVIVSSMASFLPLRFCPAYCSSKAAVRFYAESLYGNLKPYGIHVTPLCPGYIDTPMTASNTYGMPFLRTAQQIAHFFALKIQHLPVRMVYPIYTYIITMLLALLPITLWTVITSKLTARKNSL